MTERQEKKDLKIEKKLDEMSNYNIPPILIEDKIAETRCNKEIDIHILTKKGKNCQLIIEQDSSFIFLTRQKLQDLICSLIGIYTELSGIKTTTSFIKDLKQMKESEIKNEIGRFLQAILCQRNLIGLINAFESCKYRLLEINEIYDVKLDGLKIKTDTQNSR